MLSWPMSPPQRTRSGFVAAIHGPFRVNTDTTSRALDGPALRRPPSPQCDSPESNGSQGFAVTGLTLMSFS
jgi:hypothetical protein